jgi:hypothetical protein
MLSARDQQPRLAGRIPEQVLADSLRYREMERRRSRESRDSRICTLCRFSRLRGLSPAISSPDARSHGSAPRTPCSSCRCAAQVCSGGRVGLLRNPSRLATELTMAEVVAPVSTTSLKGPLPLIATGTQTRPIRSRRVGAAYRGPCASTMSSSRTLLLSACAGASSSVASAPQLQARHQTIAPTHFSCIARSPIAALASLNE